MKQFLQVFQIVVSLALALSILLQARGAGIGLLGGGQESNAFAQKRGLDRFLLQATIFLSVLFFGGALAWLFV